MYRVRLTEEGQAQFEQSLKSKQKELGSTQALPGALGVDPWMMPMEAQYWLRQSDDSYGWSPWIVMGTPEAMEIRNALECPNCGAKLIRR